MMHLDPEGQGPGGSGDVVATATCSVVDIIMVPSTFMSCSALAVKLSWGDQDSWCATSGLAGRMSVKL